MDMAAFEVEVFVKGVLVRMVTTCPRQHRVGFYTGNRDYMLSNVDSKSWIVGFEIPFPFLISLSLGQEGKQTCGLLASGLMARTMPGIQWC